MKQFIVVAATLPLLLLFIMQISYEAKTQTQRMMIYDVIDISKAEVMQEGYFTKEISDKLRKKIGFILDINPNRIEIESDKDIKYAESDLEGKNLISYKIKIPIDQIMVGRSFLGISQENNRGFYLLEGEVISSKERAIEK